VTSVSSPILVGRDGELVAIERAFAAAASGSPSIVVVGGEAGIGKTRLIAEAGERAVAGGGRMIAGACLDLADGLPYLPFVEAIRRLVRTAPPADLDAAFGPARHDFARLMPEMRLLIGDEGSDDSEPISQGRLFELGLGMVERLGAISPVLLALEDVQWIDRSSRDLITFLARNLSRERLLLALTVRTDNLPAGHPTLAWLAELTRLPRVVRIDLQRLPREAIAGQLAAILGEAPPPDLVDEVWARSEGNPFFAEELVAADETRTPDAPGPPATLAQMLAARLAALSAPARDVLAWLAVAGRPVDEVLLGAVTERPQDELVSALREGLARHVLATDPGHGRIRFRHALLAEVALGDLLPSQRRQLHDRFATVLAARHDLGERNRAGATAELAYHWTAAGRWPEAHAAAIAAGEAAETVAAYAQAHSQFERALEIADRLEPPIEAADRVALLRRAASAADLAGEMDRALELALEARTLVDASADAETAALLHARIGYLRWALGDAEGGLEDHREAVRLVPHDPPTAARARVLGALAGSLMSPGRHAESADVARAAIACATAVGATSEEARARNVLGSDLVALGDVDAGLAELTRSRELAAEAGPPDMLVVVHHNLALNLAQAGRLDEALSEALAGRDAARRLGLERRFGMNLIALAADVLLRLGRWDEADALTLEGLALDPRDRGTVYLSAVRGRLHALRGEVDEATRRLDAADELAIGELDADLAAYIRRGRAEVALARGRPDEALAAVEPVIEGAPGSQVAFVRAPLLAVGLRAAADVAERARASRDREAVTQVARTSARLREAMEGIRAAPQDAALTAVVALGDAEGRRVDGEPADWAGLAIRFDAVPDPERAAYARFRAAEQELRARGTKADAESLLRDAHSTAERLGGEPLRREIEALARRARISLAVPAAGAAAVSVPSSSTNGGAGHGPTNGLAALRKAGLSSREIEVLQLVAAGRTNGEIAERLFITRKTAGVHVTHILDKLAVSNRVEAAMVAARLGLAPTADDLAEAGEED
jgi:DNA-binding CsgD family transcriptional regulator/tetratricopeptide (TPR) repeat protein